MRQPWDIDGTGGPIITTAIHAGHDLRPEVAEIAALADEVRTREEDPHTDAWLGFGDTRISVNRSRFEVDLNRPRESAVYIEPADAWGLDVWKTPPSAELVDASLAIYDNFYATLGEICDRAAAEYGKFVVMDIHSYNHRRGGPSAPVDDPEANPELNLGTGTLDESMWRSVADAFVEATSSHPFDGGTLDVRENVRFRGGHMSRWINERYAGNGCALAIEVKKFYMDEWTGEPYEAVIATFNDVMHASIEAIRKVLATPAP